ncbi:MAG: hypothetical protein KKH72_14605 [Alphaproteobacteria bacterium]|nr:hypothetical protein [Alphaproteobacteria bacterium]
MVKLAIASGDVELVVETRDTSTTRQILAALPIRARALKWGDEVYFMVPVNAGREAGATDVIKPGEIAFWTQGHAIAIGYGETPLSRHGEIRLAAPCNIWADAENDVRLLDALEEGDAIELRRL